MSKRLSGLCACAAILLCTNSSVKAQTTGAAIINVVVMRVNTGRIERLAAAVASSGTEALLSAVIADAGTSVVSQRQLRASEGINARFEIADPSADGMLAVTPHLHIRHEVTLHIEAGFRPRKVLQVIPKERTNAADICMGEGQPSILTSLHTYRALNSTYGVRGLSIIPVLGNGSGYDQARQELMIALTPSVERTQIASVGLRRRD
jgi:hypothetical protein